MNPNTEDAFLLINSVAGDWIEIELSKSEYEELLLAKQILNNAFAIEEKYEVLLENYLKLEEELLNITSEYMIRQVFNKERIYNMRLRINIILVNYLTSTKLYLDQIKNNVPKCFLDEQTVKERINNLLKDEKENSIAYKFMSSLRNYVQHYELPIHGFSLPCKSVQDDISFWFEHGINIYSHKSKLLDNRQFSKKFLSDMDENVDIKLYTRAYTEIISHIHCKIRNIISNVVNESRDKINLAEEKIRTKRKIDNLRMNIVKKVDGKQTAFQLLTLEWDDLRKKLVNRNKDLVNLSKRYVSNKLVNIK